LLLLVFDSFHTTIFLTRDGRICLPIIFKTWVRRNPAPDAAREARREATWAIFFDAKKRKASEKEKEKEKEKVKRLKNENGSENKAALAQVKQEKMQEEQETRPQVQASVKGEPPSEEGAVRLVPIVESSNVKISPDFQSTKKVKTLVPNGLSILFLESFHILALFLYLFTQHEICIDAEMERREKRDVGWDWSYSTKKAHDFLCNVAELRRYCSQVKPNIYMIECSAHSHF